MVICWTAPRGMPRSASAAGQLVGDLVEPAAERALGRRRHVAGQPQAAEAGGVAGAADAEHAAAARDGASRVPPSGLRSSDVGRLLRLAAPAGCRPAAARRSGAAALGRRLRAAAASRRRGLRCPPRRLGQPSSFEPCPSCRPDCLDSCTCLLRELDRRRDQLGPVPARGERGGPLRAERLVHDLGVDLEDRVHQHLRARRAARQVHVHRHDVVDALHDRVVVEHAAGGGADAHRQHPARLGHLVVDLAQHRGHLVAHPAGDDHQVGLPRARPGTPPCRTGPGRSAARRWSSSRSRSRPARTWPATARTCGSS